MVGVFGDQGRIRQVLDEIVERQVVAIRDRLDIVLSRIKGRTGIAEHQ